MNSAVLSNRPFPKKPKVGTTPGGCSSRQLPFTAYGIFFSGTVELYQSNYGTAGNRQGGDFVNSAVSLLHFERQKMRNSRERVGDSNFRFLTSHIYLVSGEARQVLVIVVVVQFEVEHAAEVVLLGALGPQVPRRAFRSVGVNTSCVDAIKALITSRCSVLRFLYTTANTKAKAIFSLMFCRSPIAVV